MKFAALVIALISCSLRADAQAPVDVLRIDPHSHTRCGIAAALSSSDPDPWGTCLFIKYKNISQRSITAVRFSVVFVNAFKERSDPVPVEDDAQTLKAGKTTAMLWRDGSYWSQLGQDKMSADVSVSKVIFADGSSWSAFEATDHPVSASVPR